MFPEDDLLPISGLQHLLFCERQWALIYLEGAWAENRLTAEGAVLHERVHEQDTEVRRDVRITRSLRLRSLRLGLTGQADVVEFHRVAEEAGALCQLNRNETTVELCEAVPLPGAKGLWRPFPIEYKRGRVKKDAIDEVQLCAQALCLEEMLGVAVPAGALFYGQPRRRTEVTFTPELRAQTEALAARMHELAKAGRTPIARYEKKCDNCSLFALCLPKTIGKSPSVAGYLQRAAIAPAGEREGEASP